MRYRRAEVTGGRYCFTVHLAERKRTLPVDHMDVLRTVMKQVKALPALRMAAMAILLDHLQALWPLPEGDADAPRRWARIKTGFPAACRKTNGVNQRRIATGEREISQWPCGNTPAGM
jgi:putative transposase